MPKRKRPVMLVTGASSGLGAAFAREYAARDWDVVLVARRLDRLKALGKEIEADYGVKTYAIKADLYDPKAVPKLVSAVKAKGLKIDGLINNAGFGHPGVYLESPWEDHAKFLHLMAVVPSELARALAPDMVKRGFGRIMNVASLAGHLPGSRGHTLYSAVKSYLIKFSQSLNMELDDKGVHVSAFCPGFVYTEFHDVNGTREAISRLPEYMIMDADECAEMAADALEENKAVYISGRVNRGIALLARLLPMGVAQSLMAKNSEKFRKAEK